MVDLTVERLFGNPPLTGTLPTRLKFAPDGRYIAYLKAASDDRERLDLWRVDLDGGEHRCWLNAAELPAGDAVLSDAEKAERERKRQFSSGIADFEISPNGVGLLIPADGTGYLFDVASGRLTPFTPPGTRQTDFRFSPRGSFISYVRAHDLYYYDIPSGTEIAVTADGDQLIANGIADFIAQEEMHRFEGHWWSNDESCIAYTRTNESTVAVSQRYEIDAEAFNVIEQRYPYAGASNAEVALHVYDLASGRRHEIDYRHAPDDYLARVAWAGERVAVQAQSRDQQRLSVDLHRPGQPGCETLIEESSATWINLHDNFRVLEENRFLWTSERTGTSQLYLCADGETRQLTSGSGRVVEILHANDQSILYSGWLDRPTEQHLFSVAVKGGEPDRLSEASGWHEFVVDESGRHCIDRWTSLDNVGEIRLLDLQSRSSTKIAAENDAAEHPYRSFRSSHVTPTIGSIRAEDGQPLYYRLTQPRRIKGTHPVIVYVYGGPGVNRVRDEWAPLVLQLFAGRGFGVLELDNRGTSNRDRQFEAPIYRRLGSIEVQDQLTGVSHIQSLDWVDGERIGVFGHSYGGYMTLMCLARAPEVFKAGVSVAPVSDWSLYDTHYTERYLSTPAANPEGYRDSSLTPYLEDIRGKLLIMHGMADDNVLFTHSTKLFKALQARRFPFEMMTYPGSKHGLQEQDVSIHRFNMILDFFERSL